MCVWIIFVGTHNLLLTSRIPNYSPKAEIRNQQDDSLCLSGLSVGLSFSSMSMVFRWEYMGLMMAIALQIRGSIAAFCPHKPLGKTRHPAALPPWSPFQTSLFTSEQSTAPDISSSSNNESQEIPLYRSQGIFAVNKPLTWSSNDVVSYIRGILERDARSRGAKPVRVGSRKNKSRIVRVGHGGTLDPLATGVLVVAVGKATKELQGYEERSYTILVSL